MNGQCVQLHRLLVASIFKCRIALTTQLSCIAVSVQRHSFRAGTSHLCVQHGLIDALLLSGYSHHRWHPTTVNVAGTVPCIGASAIIIVHSIVEYVMSLICTHVITIIIVIIITGTHICACVASSTAVHKRPITSVVNDGSKQVITHS